MTDKLPHETPRFFRGAKYARHNPYILMLWLGIGGSTILFLFLALMLMVRKETVGIERIEIPSIFYFSTLLIACSSITLLIGHSCYRKEQYRYYLNWTGMTVALGLMFMMSQAMGWISLYRSGIRIGSSMGMAYFTLFCGLHVVHMAAGITFLCWALLDAAKSKTYVEGYIQSLNPAKQTRLRLATQLWHYLDFLWLALFGLLLLVNR